MEKRQKLSQSILIVAIGTVLLLMIPLVAMQFTNEVVWSTSDFIFAGILIFSTGLAYVLITRAATNIIYRAAAASAIGSTLLFIWVNLAVGLIGSGPNAGNLMYIGVLAVIIIGTIRSRFTARGMEQAMFATAFSFVLHAVIALVTKMDRYAGSSVFEIIAVNAFFATLFGISGLLFRHVATEEAKRKSAGA